MNKIIYLGVYWAKNIWANYMYCTIELFTLSFSTVIYCKLFLFFILDEQNFLQKEYTHYPVTRLYIFRNISVKDNLFFSAIQ